MTSDSLNSSAEQVFSAVRDARHILITAHYNPDGDNAGSCLALYQILQSMGKTVSVFNQDPLPGFLVFLPGAAQWEVWEDEHTPSSDVDLIFILDSSDLTRIGMLSDFCKGRTLINIDHHVSNTRFGDMNIVKEDYAATAEILTELFQDWQLPLNPDAASALFAGLASDTGFFRFSSTKARTLQTAAVLVSAGAEPHIIDQHLNQSRDPSFLSLVARAFASLEWYAGKKIAVAMLRLEDFSDLESNDTEGIVNLLGIVAGVEVFVLIRQKEPDLVSASVRSKNYVDVNAAVQPLGGGGHKRAAGCRTTVWDIDTFKDKLVEHLLLRLSQDQNEV